MASVAQTLSFLVLLSKLVCEGGLVKYELSSLLLKSAQTSDTYPSCYTVNTPKIQREHPKRGIEAEEPISLSAGSITCLEAWFPEDTGSQESPGELTLTQAQLGALQDGSMSHTEPIEQDGNELGFACSRAAPLHPPGDVPLTPPQASPLAAPSSNSPGSIILKVA
ncbi:hypothetical protein SKAU_G00311410 [Synaphobranchus kaupii]|uniref:Uncharacterized protein n=1 Tax=Synaphobranchus kaupii TaxID=118154 RepID=A0A9Q1IL97_SYNKA|nr:hypothetical protein SKAU_G00311410 [Synaphobranchus kaupii]